MPPVPREWTHCEDENLNMKLMAVSNWLCGPKGAHFGPAHIAAGIQDLFWEECQLTSTLMKGVLG